MYLVDLVRNADYVRATCPPVLAGVFIVESQGKHSVATQCLHQDSPFFVRGRSSPAGRLCVKIARYDDLVVSPHTILRHRCQRVYVRIVLPPFDVE